jgi:hypothetical protein
MTRTAPDRRALRSRLRAGGGSRGWRLVADALDDGVRHRAGGRGPIGVAQSVKPLDRPHERVVDGLAKLTASEVRACAPTPDAASLAIGDVGQTLARLLTPAEEKPLDHAHVRLDASSGHCDSHRTIHRACRKERMIASWSSVRGRVISTPSANSSLRTSAESRQCSTDCSTIHATSRKRPRTSSFRSGAICIVSADTRSCSRGCTGSPSTRR